ASGQPPMPRSVVAATGSAFRFDVGAAACGVGAGVTDAAAPTGAGRSSTGVAVSVGMVTRSPEPSSVAPVSTALVSPAPVVIDMATAAPPKLNVKLSLPASPGGAQ